MKIFLFLFVFLRLQYRLVGAHLKSSWHTMNGYPSMTVPVAHTYSLLLPSKVPPGFMVARSMSIGIPQSAVKRSYRIGNKCIKHGSMKLSTIEVPRDV